MKNEANFMLLLLGVEARHQLVFGFRQIEGHAVWFREAAAMMKMTKLTYLKAVKSDSNSTASHPASPRVCAASECSNQQRREMASESGSS